MKTRLRNILLTLLCFAILAVPAAAGTFTYNVSLPTDAFALQERQMAEMRAFAGLDISLIAVDTIDVPARERAQEMWDDSGTALWGVGAEVSDAAVVIVYDVEHNDAGVVRSEGAKALLTDADVDAVEAAFAAPDSDDPYVHVINGLKKLEICALDGGDVPAYSYAAQFLRDPDSVPDAAPGPDSRIIVATDDRNDAADASCTYLADEIGRWSGVSVDVMIGSASPADDALALRTAAYEEDPDTTVVFAYDPASGEAAASIGDAAAAELPADAADRSAPPCARPTATPTPARPPRWKRSQKCCSPTAPASSTRIPASRSRSTRTRSRRAAASRPRHGLRLPPPSPSRLSPSCFA